MKIIEKNISDLAPYENNPRINDRAVEPVAESIKQFGFQQPIVIDKHNVVIAGHTLLKAAQLLGLAKVPVVIASDLTEDQVRACRLVDNKTNELSEWDMPILSKELDELHQAGMVPETPDDAVTKRFDTHRLRAD